ncbi:MAG: hypothetical protein Q8J66_05635 [Methylotenera sp.]|nr:hypothetical protein [Methylotenera sp.]
MKLNIIKLIALLAIGSSVNAYAAEEVDNKASQLLMYIQPVDYTNPIRLWHPYYDYWMYQGPVVEKVAMTKFTEAYGDVGMCEVSQSGKALVWLQPKLFYNPQVQLFYGEVAADVYKGIGEHLGEYVGKSQVRGFLNMHAEASIEEAYALAVADVVAKMQADTTLQTRMSNQAKSSTAESTPCGMVTLFPTKKIRAMSF